MAMSSGAGRFVEHVLGDHAVGDQSLVAGRDGPALEVLEGTLVGQDVLDPQPGCVRVRAAGHDALGVVRAVDPVARDRVLEREAGLLDGREQAGEVVRPVEHDRRLAGEDRCLA